MSIQEKIMAARRAAGLLVRVTYEGREPFNYYATDADARDSFIHRTCALIGAPDVLGHVVLSVEVVS